MEGDDVGDHVAFELSTRSGEQVVVSRVRVECPNESEDRFPETSQEGPGRVPGGSQEGILDPIQCKSCGLSGPHGGPK